ncbi:hypothetical protein HDE_12736 [Halotydeus destructor]|nr:hypothetical protein HDE_12736 [Halotydeus destructor]
MAVVGARCASPARFGLTRSLSGSHLFHFVPEIKSHVPKDFNIADKAINQSADKKRHNGPKWALPNDVIKAISALEDPFTCDAVNDLSKSVTNIQNGHLSPGGKKPETQRMVKCKWKSMASLSVVTESETKLSRSCSHENLRLK